MISFTRRVSFLSIFLVYNYGVATAQQLSCDKLQQIIQVAAADSTFQSLKGTEKISANGKIKEYDPLITLWAANDLHQSQFISYNSYSQHVTYDAYLDFEGDEVLAKQAASNIKNKFHDCLTINWILKSEKNARGDSVFHFKNKANFVVIEIESVSGSVLIECYNDSRDSFPVCVSGDCNSFYGTRHYFNEDTYTGTAIDGSLSGVGNISWYSLGMHYEGSFIDNQASGYGTMYYKDQVLSTGMHFKGDPFTVDTTKKGCQAGNCETGFGLKVLDGGIYIGNFKDGLFDGLGQSITPKVTFYGYFQKNVINGKGITVKNTGEYTFATYANGRPSGMYEKVLADKTSIEANADDGTGSMFDAENILIKSGTWIKGVFTESTGDTYLYTKALAQSIRDFSAYRPTGYKAIRGEQNKLLKSIGAEGYKSTLLFMGMYDTRIGVDGKNYYYVTFNLSSKSPDKTKWVNVYNNYYNILNKAIGRYWGTNVDNGYAAAGKKNTSIEFQNLFNKTRLIKLSLSERGVEMEMH